MNICVLTSGGDAPGMNAALRSIVRSAVKRNIKVFGARHGYKGLIENDFVELDVNSVANIIHRGGTILKTARSNEFKTEEGLKKAKQNIERNSIDAIIAIGGDGTLRGAFDLIKMGIKVYHIPATIDNDISYTDYTIGFDTAVNTVLSAVNNIRETGMSHDKTTIIEVMGRDCGEIALRAGTCGGVDAILIPEIETDFDDLLDTIVCGQKRCKKHNIIIRAEGADISTEELANRLKKATGEDIRTVILGYLQRGGTPSAHDIYISTLMGERAVVLAERYENSKAIAFKNNSVCELAIDAALRIKREPDLALLKIIKELA